MGTAPVVSVVIAAWNASRTLTACLDSLACQTFTRWEAIIVDDGSRDKTPEIARTYAKRDSRVRLLIQDHRGSSAARNAGIGAARSDWLVFLDSDDLLEKRHIESLVEATIRNPSIDMVLCGWARFGKAGQRISTHDTPPPRQLFAVLTRGCPIAISACLIRRSVVKEARGFDESLPTCQDWDLWQRIARAGVRHEFVSEVLALYRARPGSESLNPRDLIRDGFRIIARGHARDERVRSPHPWFADGMPSYELPGALLEFTAWVAGLSIGQGSDPRRLLQERGEDPVRDLDVTSIAHSLGEACVVAMSRPMAEWPDLWPSLEPRIEAFLTALENHSKSPALRRRVKVALERIILEQAPVRETTTLGSTSSVPVEVGAHLCDFKLQRGVERVRLAVTFAGEHLGDVELPVCDGHILSYVARDAIAAKLAWPILGRFLERTVYPALRVEPRDGSFLVFRGGLLLAQVMAVGELPPKTLHDTIGWLVFLQEIWDRPTRPLEWFYDVSDSDDEEEIAPEHEAHGRQLIVEVSGTVPNVRSKQADLTVVTRVGGVAVGCVEVPLHRRGVTARELRSRITSSGAFELCRAAVREGIIGRSLDEGSLAERLRHTAALAPASTPAALDDIAGHPGANVSTLVLSRRRGRISGTSAARRAAFPSGSAPNLVNAAVATGELARCIGEVNEQPLRALYAPEILALDESPRDHRDEVAELDNLHSPLHGRAHFEALFAAGSDPWRYTSEYEQRKYEQTLRLIPDGLVQDALEIGCAEGHFTAQLAPHVRHLVATDISDIALARAAQRCRTFQHVEYARLDVAADAIPGRFDLIVCSEVLYFMEDLASLKTVAKKIAAGLKPGGHLIMAHANLVVDEPDEPGFDWDFSYGAKVIGDIFGGRKRLRFLAELRTPLYRIQLFQRLRMGVRMRRGYPRKVVELQDQPTPLEPDVASHVLWHGGIPRRAAAKSLTTHRLPILMYHRIAPQGPNHLRRYRITPDAFQQQMFYLRDGGYHTVSLAAWRDAVENKTPLPGRAILISFDDACEDFLMGAWPVLRRCGFGATVFVPTSFVGGHNEWDAHCGDRVPLLSWEQMRTLQQEGVQFGSHSVTHPFLTGLSWEAAVREAAESRAALHRHLCGPIEGFAYPYGDTDPSLEHLVGACGYDFGVTTQPRHALMSDSLLALPRIEVRGDETFEQFVNNLGS